MHGDLSVRELDQAEAITQTEVFESTVVTLVVGCIFGKGMKLPRGFKAGKRPQAGFSAFIIQGLHPTFETAF